MNIEDLHRILIIGAGTMGQQIGFQCATQWGKCRTWADYRTWLGTHGSSSVALGVNVYRAPEVDWQP